MMTSKEYKQITFILDYAEVELNKLANLVGHENFDEFIKNRNKKPQENHGYIFH